VTERHPSPDRFALPPELIEAIKDDDYACVTLATDRGTALVAKLPASEIDAFRGTYPIQLRHELFEHPAAPVIRITATLYDNPDQPFLLETFINIADADQRTDYAEFADQDELPILFYDDQHQFRLAKAVNNGPRETVPQILEVADRLLHQISEGCLDFDRAKTDVMALIDPGSLH
jgi:hypothetical protein